MIVNFLVGIINIVSEVIWLLHQHFLILEHCTKKKKGTLNSILFCWPYQIWRFKRKTLLRWVEVDSPNRLVDLTALAPNRDYSCWFFMGVSSVNPSFGPSDRVHQAPGAEPLHCSLSPHPPPRSLPQQHFAWSLLKGAEWWDKFWKCEEPNYKKEKKKTFSTWQAWCMRKSELRSVQSVSYSLRVQITDNYYDRSLKMGSEVGQLWSTSF